MVGNLNHQPGLVAAAHHLKLQQGLVVAAQGNRNIVRQPAQQTTFEYDPALGLVRHGAANMRQQRTQQGIAGT